VSGRRHPVHLPRLGRRRRSRSARDGRTRVRGARPARLGAHRFHARRRRPQLVARSQHRTGHDQPFADAQVGCSPRRVVRGTVLAHPGADALNAVVKGMLDSAALRVAVWSLALALVALPVVAVVNGWIGAERWPLRTLRVQGDLQRVDAAKLRAVVLPHARRGFFAVRLDDAQAAVADLAWVEHAEVRKRWPDVLEVTVVEHRPFARWGGDRVLSEEGKLFP